MRLALALVLALVIIVPNAAGTPHATVEEGCEVPPDYVPPVRVTYEILDVTLPVPSGAKVFVSVCFEGTSVTLAYGP